MCAEFEDLDSLNLHLRTFLEDLFGHCVTLTGLNESSWTIMDPQMDPANLISGDPW